MKKYTLHCLLLFAVSFVACCPDNRTVIPHMPRNGLMAERDSIRKDAGQLSVPVHVQRGFMAQRYW